MFTFYISQDSIGNMCVAREKRTMKPRVFTTARELQKRAVFAKKKAGNKRLWRALMNIFPKEMYRSDVWAKSLNKCVYCFLSLSLFLCVCCCIIRYIYILQQNAPGCVMHDEGCLTRVCAIGNPFYTRSTAGCYCWKAAELAAFLACSWYLTLYSRGTNRRGWCVPL